jgi:hypothetical protein
MVGMLLSLLVAEKSGFAVSDNPEMLTLKELADKMTKQIVESLGQSNGAPPTPDAAVASRR